MTTLSSLLTANLIRAAFAGAVIAAVATVTAQVGARSAERDVGVVASLELSAMPKVRSGWQRPAPVTWSARFNVRWEARWSNDAKYMV